MGEEMQYYKVFYTDRPLPAGEEPDYFFIIPLDFVTKEEAMSKAFKLIFSGAVVWKIEGPDGFRIDRKEIERQYRIFKST